MLTILVTGSNGQLGNEIKKLAPNFAKYKFLFTDIQELDITEIQDVEDFFQKYSPNYLINCAAYTAVDKAEKESTKASLINQLAVENLAIACNKHNTKFIQISTDYVFDGNAFKPYKETDRTNPQSVYGFTKAAGEKIVMENMMMNYLIIRTSWLYSSFGNNFVKTMLRLGKERQELNIIFDQIGSPTYAADLAQAILEIIRKTEQKERIFNHGTYHFSNEGVASWYDFTIEIMKLARLDCKIKPIESKDYPTPAKRPFYSVLNKAKIKNTFAIEIPYWKDSLKECIKLLSNE